jgi:hypothetical protein
VIYGSRGEYRNIKLEPDGHAQVVSLARKIEVTMVFSASSPFLRMGLFMSLILIAGMACDKKAGPTASATSAPQREVNAKFTLMDYRTSGVDFQNQMKEDYNYNNFVFEYMYNGGGVAAGDVNGDSLPDLYFSSSRFGNKLYLNRGNFKFVDISAAAGVEALEGFKTGVAMADINGDGRLDIYVSRTSKTDDGLKNDIVYINTGSKLENGLVIPKFEDQAKQLGIVDNSNTNHSCFFDFDRDGDLDLFLVCHKLGFTEANKLRIQQTPEGKTVRQTFPETPFESNRLYRNDNGRFVDVTQQAGMLSSTYGLSATAADFNEDGWLDLYVANDYVEPDFIYINNRDGTFTDHFTAYLRHSSHSSMGVDIADINNDGLNDVMVLEMKSEDPVRYKGLMNIMLYDRYNLMVQHGYGRQMGRNVLQVNNGNGTFSEIGQYAGVDATDWSWGVLMADFDNDGWKDMHISNGYRKDVSQLDYLNYFRDSLDRAGGLTSSRYPDIQEFIKYLPEKKIRNYFYLNDGKLNFYDATNSVGMTQVSFSNGSAYADLDRDGDLDIIVNNIDEPAFIYRNDSKGQNWLQIDVEYLKGNKDGFGTTAYLYAGNQMQHQVLMSSKGFFSTSEPILHFGLGDKTTIDSLILQWPDGKSEIMRNVQANRRLVWKPGSGTNHTRITRHTSDPLFAREDGNLQWKHEDDDFVDVKRERLLPYMMSSEGPCLATGDINGDKLTDIFAGNGRGYPASVFVQQPSGSFSPLPSPVIAADASYEDCGASLEDFDSDGDVDMIVISGGNAMPDGDPSYHTRYYQNDGKGGFSRVGEFPITETNAGTILAFDYDQDNDKDVFIGGRSTPGAFPNAPKSYLLRNDNGKFTDVTNDVFPIFDRMGMLTDMESGDLDGDGKPELIVVGDWMPIRIFSYDGKHFDDKSDFFGIKQASGWWKSVAVVDLDGDGDMDVVAGNMGTNHRLQATPPFPLTMVYNDFDENGSVDPIMSYYQDGKLVPYAQRDAIIGQIPVLKKKFNRYNTYARASLEDVFSKEQLNESKYLYTETFTSVIYKNENGKLVLTDLPYQAQLHPVFDIIPVDLNGDRKLDLILAGNFIYNETETGEIDAGNGTVLLQQADGTFAFMPNREHGFWAQGEVRELKLIARGNGSLSVVTGNNRGALEIHNLLKSPPVQ